MSASTPGDAPDATLHVTDMREPPPVAPPSLVALWLALLAGAAALRAGLSPTGFQRFFDEALRLTGAEAALACAASAAVLALLVAGPVVVRRLGAGTINAGLFFATLCLGGALGAAWLADDAWTGCLGGLAAALIPAIALALAYDRDGRGSLGGFMGVTVGIVGLLASVALFGWLSDVVGGFVMKAILTIGGLTLFAACGVAFFYLGALAGLAGERVDRAFRAIVPGAIAGALIGLATRALEHASSS